MYATNISFNRDQSLKTGIKGFDYKQLFDSPYLEDVSSETESSLGSSIFNKSPEPITREPEAPEVTERCAEGQ